ncbi:MAG TPA: dTMP kinase [Bacteroidetes bacterium]|nr:dTMP kinase [Bacteroidota bacterium]HEX04919.1 dTMP kinase [Bacteroidota bacterium]
MIKDYKGILIALEGIDGSGKSTQWKRLGEWLKSAQEREVVMSVEPTNGPHGQALRDAWASGIRLPVEEEIELFVLDRDDHLDEVILPALEKGSIVLLDRYYYSSAVYQGTQPDQSIEAVLREFEDFCPRADLMLLFDLPAHVAMQRMHAGRSVLDVMEKLDNLRKVRSAYLRLGRKETRIVDAALSEELVWEQTWKIVESFLAER